VQYAGVLACLFKQFRSYLVVANNPRQLGHFELEFLFGLVPLEIHNSLTIISILLEIEIKSNFELLSRRVEQSRPLDSALRLAIIQTLIRLDFGVRNEIVSESMSNFGEILPIETDVQHKKGTFVVEVRNVRDFAAYYFVLVDSLRTDPVLAVLSFGLLLFLLIHLVVLKTNGYAVYVC
jgi:hypothetical protein